MARRLTEEQITKAILVWLDLGGWKIVCFDFPQSGTGVILHPNPEFRESTKNKGAFIPDIVAVKEPAAVFFENKDRFVFSDFEKINDLRTDNIFSNAINLLLRGYQIRSIYYGIGVPFQKSIVNKSLKNLQMTDFIIFVEDDRGIKIGFEKQRIFTS